MPNEIRIYFEGHRALRPGFLTFFSELRNRARGLRCPFEVVAAKSGDEACQAFGIALRSHPDAWNILLRDSEGPIRANSSGDICRAYGWQDAQAGSIFWMVEMMEAWFHADKDAIEDYYGASGFVKGTLKANPNVEEISKRDLEDGLSRATRDTKKGDYFRNKTAHGPHLLARIKPALVVVAAPNCRRLFEVVSARLQ
jgi:hypothetical protein